MLKEEKALPLKKIQNALGLMAAASAVCRLGLLHMRPLQCWLKARIPSHEWLLGSTRILVTRECLEEIALCTNAALNKQAVSMG